MLDVPGHLELLASDQAFDAVFPPALREVSPRQFTPVAIARRAAALLVVSPATRVLDVGSGAGKLCLVGAMEHPGQFTGLERRPELVDVARGVAARLGLDVDFRRGELGGVDWRAFDAFYFYNPFAEHILIDRERFYRDVQDAKDRLRAAPDGTRVVTYHGLGACLPGGYKLLLREPAGHDSLDLWIKAPRRHAAPNTYGVIST